MNGIIMLAVVIFARVMMDVIDIQEGESLTQALLFFACKKYSSYNRDNSLTVERHFGGGKGSTPFYFFAVRR